MENCQVDLAIYSDTKENPQFVCEILCKEEIVIVARKGDPLLAYAEERKNCRYPWINVKNLEGRPFVINDPEQTTGRVTRTLLAESVTRPNVILQTRNSSVALEMAFQGIAYCVAPESYVRYRGLSSFECFSFGSPVSESCLYAIHQNGHYLSRYAKHFINTAKNVMREVLN